MPEIRKCPIAGHRVIIAKNRAARPFDLIDVEVAAVPTDDCPFCEGNERETPHEILAYRLANTDADGPGWRVRVVPNKFPALAIDADSPVGGHGLYESTSGIGIHEVIIESPRHLTSTTQLGADDLADVLWIYRERLSNLKRDPRLVYPIIFKNMGLAAGASLAHLHGQLVVLPIVPHAAALELDGSSDFYRAHGQCVICRMIDEERALGRRMVLDTPDFAAFCPFAARVPFETWIVPTKHSSHFETLRRPGADALARVIGDVLRRIEFAMERPAYNYFIHTAPFDTHPLAYYHWHIEIIPRITKTAGFEWATGVSINPLPPEEAADILGNVVPLA